VLFTTCPTINILHAVGYLNDSDTKLAEQYHVVISPTYFGKPKEPLVTLQTKYGELNFDLRGKITLQPRVD
jgi:hypothetical protein